MANTGTKMRRDKSRRLYVCALFAGTLLLAGCGGGGSAPATGSVPSAPATLSAGATAQSGTITLTFPRPGSAATANARRRRPQYVSPNAAAIVITVVSVDGVTTLPPGVPSPTTVQLSTPPAAASNCTISGGFESCTIPIPTPPGSVAYNFQILGPAPTNAVLSEGNVTQTIVAGTSGANVATVLLGLVAGVSVAPPSFAFGVPSTARIIISSTDATGATITGSSNFWQPYTLTDNDTLDGTSLTDGTQQGPSVTVMSPNDVVNLVYPGLGPNPPATFTFTVSGASIPPAFPPAGSETPQGAVAFSGTYTDSTATGGNIADPNWSQQTLFFGAINSTLAFTATQSGYSGGFTVTLDPTTCGSGTPIATISSADQKTFNVTANAFGICKATVTGGGGANALLYFSIKTANLSLN
jgi:hypothetical protein